MSEINSIANGTYVIGETSATNFIAGNGIKIDSPSAGTVRIGNDETVLWEGSAAITSGTQNIATNEPATSFKAIKIYGESWQGWAPVLWGEVSGDNHKFSLAPSYLGANGAAIRICQVMFNYADSGYEVENGRLFSLQGSSVSSQAPQNTWLRKIVGIGRKS